MNMPVTQRTGGVVVSTSKSGSTRVAIVKFPNPTPPPDFLPDVTIEVDSEDLARLERAMLANPQGKVDVDADWAATPPVSPAAIKVHT